MKNARVKKSILVLAVGCVLSLGLALAKLFVGLSCNSLCIMMDSVNSFFDVATGMVAVAAFCMLFHAPTERHPYGWGRSEYLAGFVVAAATVAMGGAFLMRSVNRLAMPEPVYFGLQNCILICAAWVGKAGMALFYYLANKRLHSKALRALLMDSVADIGVTTISVVSFAVSSRLSYAVDAWLGLAVSICTIVFGLRLVWENGALLLGRGDIEEEIAAVRKTLADCPDVLRVEKVQLHDYGYRNKYGFAVVTIKQGATPRFEQPQARLLQDYGVHLQIAATPDHDAT